MNWCLLSLQLIIDFIIIMLRDGVDDDVAVMRCE
jgi:hypothetical protein